MGLLSPQGPELPHGLAAMEDVHDVVTLNVREIDSGIIFVFEDPVVR